MRIKNLVRLALYESLILVVEGSREMAAGYPFAFSPTLIAVLYVRQRPNLQRHLMTVVSSLLMVLTSTLSIASAR